MFLSFNANWGNIRGGYPTGFASSAPYTGIGLYGEQYETLVRALENLGHVLLPGTPLGDWSDVKPSLGEGPLESGVFDRPKSDVSTVLSSPVESRGGNSVLGGIAVTTTETDEEGIEWGGGFGPSGPFADKPPTDWEEVASRSEPTITEEPVAVDWGNVVSGAIDIIQGQQVGGGASQSFQPYTGGSQGLSPYPISTPAQVTVDTRTGKVTPCRRRRRRRLLTPTDLSDLAALAAVVGKGDALKLAVAKAVRR